MDRTVKVFCFDRRTLDDRCSPINLSIAGVLRLRDWLVPAPEVIGQISAASGRLSRIAVSISEKERARFFVRASWAAAICVSPEKTEPSSVTIAGSMPSLATSVLFLPVRRYSFHTL